MTAIIVKEYNLLKSATRIGLGHKLRFLHNAVPIVNEAPTYQERDIDILFLNSPRKERNVLFLIDVFHRILKERPNLNIVIAGFSILNTQSTCVEPKYQKQVINKVKELKLDQKITLLEFVSNSVEFYKRSKIFIFPANIVFCNYSLIESMSYGCVPIVSNGEGADLIVNKNNGIIAENKIHDYLYAIEKALSPEKWNEYSKSAVQTIRSDFSIDSWYKNICKIRKEID